MTNKFDYTTFPETPKEALEHWDNDFSVWSVELGGFGPSYEQAIQIGIFEMIRNINCSTMVNNIISNKDNKDELDELLSPISDKFDLQLSGGQAGAIKHFVYSIFKNGYRETLKKYPEDRYIQVSKNWPCSHKKV